MHHYITTPNVMYTADVQMLFLDLLITAQWLSSCFVAYRFTLGWRVGARTTIAVLCLSPPPPPDRPLLHPVALLVLRHAAENSVCEATNIKKQKEKAAQHWSEIQAKENAIAEDCKEENDIMMIVKELMASPAKIEGCKAAVLGDFCLPAEDDDDAPLHPTLTRLHRVPKKFWKKAPR